MTLMKGLTLIGIMEELTTQAAANFLGISPQYLVRLLEENKIPFHRTGTHRRIYFKDLLEFRKKRDGERQKAIRNLARKELNEGTYDEFVVPDEA
jgi:excisionase family DNA binding protein